MNLLHPWQVRRLSFLLSLSVMFVIHLFQLPDGVKAISSVKANISQKFIDDWLLSRQLIALKDDNSRIAEVGFLRGDDRIFLVDDAAEKVHLRA